MVISRILTLHDAAKALRIPVTSVYRYARHGKLPAFQVGKHWRIWERDLEQFITKERKKPHAN